MSEISVIFLCFTVALVGLSAYVIVKQQYSHDIERKEWMVERKDLMDRIQAPTFNDYANKVVREKKAEQPPEEKVEKNEYIS
jgi:hypothetical protein